MRPHTEVLAGLEGEQLAGALIALDRISRPLTVREMDTLCAKADISRSFRKALLRALAGVAVVAIARVD